MKRQKTIVVKILLCFALLLVSGIAWLTVQLIAYSHTYSQDLPASGVYVCNDLDIKLSFEGDAIYAQLADKTIPVWLDYGDNLCFDDGDVYPIATNRWNIENNTLILKFRKAPNWAEQNVPYVFVLVD